MYQTNTLSAHMSTNTIIVDTSSNRFAVVAGSPPLVDGGGRRATGDQLAKWVERVASWTSINQASETELAWMKKAR